MLVSIFLPTKDRLALLQRAVNSVLRQSHRDFELLVVDDGSRDATAAYMQAMVRSDARIRFLRHDEPRGAPAARNTALRSARGEWATGLDDDDEFLPERLERFVSEATRLQTAGTPFSGLYSLELIVSTTRSYTLRKPATVAHADLFRYNHIGNQLFARRSAFLDAGLFDEAMPAWQDLELFMRVVDRFGPARLVPEVLYRLSDHHHGSRISHQKKERLLEAWERIARKWPAQSSLDLQRLYLQLLAPFYGLPIELSDLHRYVALGIGPAAWAALVKLLLDRRRLPGRTVGAGEPDLDAGWPAVTPFPHAEAEP